MSVNVCSDTSNNFQLCCGQSIRPAILLAKKYFREVSSQTAAMSIVTIEEENKVCISCHSPPSQNALLLVELVRHRGPVYLHRRCEHYQLVPLRDLKIKPILSGELTRNRRSFVSQKGQLMKLNTLIHALTTSRKKSTCGRLWTKNLTGCRSIVT